MNDQGDRGGSVTPSADVDPTALIGAGTSVWHLAQVREHAVIGTDCVLGRGAYVGTGVRIGDRVKIQNAALVYEPAVVADDVFIGPAVVLTNDRSPRAVSADGRAKGRSDWQAVGVDIARGASIGAASVCVAPVRVGEWAMVGAGSVVVRDVPDFALVVGNPARQVGWVGRSGTRLLPDGEGRWVCPVSGRFHVETAHGLSEQPERDPSGGPA